MQNVFHNFAESDIRFGNHYHLLDEEKAAIFYPNYCKALVIKLIQGSLIEDNMQFFSSAFEKHGTPLITDLLKANKEINMAELKKFWNFHKEAFLIDMGTLEEHLFKKQLASAPFVEALVQQIAHNMRRYAQGSKFHAPFSAICQSSGSGKTKMMLGMGEFSILFYICARPDGRSGCPNRSTIMEVIKNFTNATDFLALFVAIFQTFLSLIKNPSKVEEICHEHVGENGEKHFFKSFSLLLADPETGLHKEFWKDVADRIDTIKEAAAPSRSDMEQSINSKGCPQPAPVTNSKTQEFTVESFYKLALSSELIAEKAASKNLKEWRLFPEDMDLLLTSLMSDVVNAASELPGAPKDSKQPSIPIIFVFDEARNLLRNAQFYDKSLFRCLRHACITLKHNGYILLADTTSKVSNFAFAIENDPSSREIPVGGDLFPPFLYLPFLNVIRVLWKNNVVVPEFADAANVGWARLQYDPLDCVSRSRPVFVVAANAIWRQPARLRFERAVALAKSKLQATFENSQRQKLLYRSIAAGLLDLTFSDFKVNDELVASFMAAGISLTEDRTFLTARYLPEAVLSEACASWYKENRDHVLKQLAFDLEHGLALQADSGVKGETLASFVLLLAKFDLDTKKHEGVVYPHCIPATVKEYFQVLFNGESSVMSGLDEEVANSFLAFNAVRQSDTKITKKLLLDAWRSRYIVLCPAGTVGIDLVIPIVKGQKGGTPVIASEETVSAISVQVKNYKRPLFEGSLTENRRSNSVKDICAKMVESQIIPNSWLRVGILMTVGGGGFSQGCNEVQRIDINGSAFNIFCLHSLDAGGLKPPEYQFLERIGDPSPLVPTGVQLQFSSLADARKKQLSSQVLEKWQVYGDPDPLHPVPDPPYVTRSKTKDAKKKRPLPPTSTVAKGKRKKHPT